MSKNNAFKVEDFADHDDSIDPADEDLGNDGASDDDNDEEEEEEEKPAKPAKPAKKSAKKDDEKPAADEEGDEEEEGEEEEEEEPDDKPPAKTPAELQLEKKLARTSKAREGLENQVRELQNKLQEQTQQRSDASKEKFDKLVAELDGLYEQVEEHRAAGKAGEAAKAQRRIDEIRDGMNRSHAAMLATRDAMQQTELRAYNTMVAELETLDPRFDPDADDFDQELQDNVNELVDGYEAKGMALTDALRKACKLLLREDVFAKGRSLKREKPTPAAEKPAPRKTDVDKNLKASKKQPPDAPGLNKEKAPADIDMATISEADFDKLPESTLRRLLGSEA